MQNRKISVSHQHIQGPAFDLLSHFDRYLNNNSNDENERLIFVGVKLAQYAIESHKIHEYTAVHKVLFELAYNYFYLFSYDDNNWLSVNDFAKYAIDMFTLMGIPVHSDFNSNDESKVWQARRDMGKQFVDGLHKIVHSTWGMIWERKDICYRFNLKMSDIVRCLKKSDHQELEADGRIARVYIPEWLKTNIVCRDKGLCQHCNDVAVSVSIPNQEQHFDHMVPLAVGGTNDATNFVLSCADCNRRKSASIIPQNSTFYWPPIEPIGTLL